MQIQIDRLKAGPHLIEVNEEASAFPVLKDLVEQGSVSFETVITGSIKVGLVASVVEVEGRLEAQVASACGRCLVPVPASMVADFKLCYADNLVHSDVEGEEEVELFDEDLELVSYDGNEIDLRPDVEQEIVMALPQQKMCSSDCKGLCVVCGGNLNNAQCACEPPVFHSGLAALKNLKINK